MLKKILFIIALVLSTLGGCYVGKVSESLDLMNRTSGDSLSNVDLGNIQVTEQTGVTNILLIGSDSRSELGSEKYGRSDTTMIATIDNNHKCLKLTSLMRDMNVDIPGYGKHKFNASYAYGGPELLYKTIAQNFGIRLDGYAEVDFQAFKDMVNEIGGVEVELTSEEAQYLNTTNYINGKKNRNVKAGWNTMNGAQALGYCRVRKVANINGTNNDQGRTERQRMVMSAVFAKIKTMPMSKWQDVIDAILPNVTTDISNKEILNYATTVVMMGTTEVHPCQIPVEGHYTDGSSPTDGDILEIDLQENKDLLHEFIFDYDGKKAVEALSEKEGDQ